MKKYDLLRSGDSIVRVLEIQSDRVLVIDCIKVTMPIWVEPIVLETYSEYTSNELSKVTGIRPEKNHVRAVYNDCINSSFHIR